MKIIKSFLLIAMCSAPALPHAGKLFRHDHGKPDIIEAPAPAAFSVCLNHSCASVETHSLNTQEWKEFTAPLRVPAATAEEERDAIAEAIAVMEKIIGPRSGTDQDLGRNLRGLGKSGQMDCIDESTNTTSYLYMLEQAGYLKWHTLLMRSTRFGIFAGMPHTTAVIRENATGKRFSVDSWFFDNGVPPAIVELSAWKKGWNPGDALP